MHVLEEIPPYRHVLSLNNMHIYLAFVDWLEISNLYLFDKWLQKAEFDKKFVKKQNKKLIIIGPTPDYQYSIPLKVYENFKFNEKLDVKNINYFEKAFQDEIRFFKSIADGDSVIYLDALKAFCLPACQIRDQTNGNLFYFDEGHLTVSGASFLVSRLGAGF